MRHARTLPAFAKDLAVEHWTTRRSLGRSRDPRNYPSSLERLQKTMDCRVKPGNDDTVDNSRDTGADNRRRRHYINRARHVRAFGVWIGLAK
jgi:hypothetical protein